MNKENKEFKFDLNAKRIRITDKEILDSLINFYKISKKPFTTAQYNNWNDRVCTSDTICDRFGSWRKALSHIGITHGIQAHTYTPEELMDNLEMVWRELGYPPGKRMLSRHGYRISERPYINRWGSVSNACRQLKLFKDGKIEESVLLKTKSPTARKTIPIQIRWRVLKRDNYQCVKCGKKPPEVQLEVDHIIPRSKGGPDIEENFQTLCDKCNGGKFDSNE